MKQQTIISNGQAKNGIAKHRVSQVEAYQKLCIGLIDCFATQAQSFDKFKKGLDEHVRKVQEEASVPVHKMIFNDFKAFGQKMLLML